MIGKTINVSISGLEADIIYELFYVKKVRNLNFGISNHCANQGHPQKRGPFDPEAFDAEKITKRLRRGK